MENKKLLIVQNQLLDLFVKKMYKDLDADNKEEFLRSYESWHTIRDSIYKNPCNCIGHKLSNEIENYYKRTVQKNEK